MVQWNHMSSMVPRAIGGIGREEQRLGVHQLGEDDDRVVLSTETLEALAERRGRGGREGVHVGVHPVEEAEVVVELLQGLGAGRSVGELQAAQAGLDAVGRGDRPRVS